MKARPATTTEGTTSNNDWGNIAEAWNGSSWASVQIPNVSSSDDPVGVSCASSTFCMAVGSSSEDNPLIEEWNGRLWSAVSSPGSSSPPSAADTETLSAVSCPSTSFCIAVGSSGPSTAPPALGEQWNSISWSAIGLSPGLGAGLDGVSCPTTSSCMAVGQGDASAQWNGTSWSTDDGPPSLATSAPTLHSVSCENATTCTAVGGLNATFSGTLTEQWDGTAWTVVQTPAPANDEIDNLLGVSCLGSTCSSVGLALAGLVRSAAVTL